MILSGETIREMEIVDPCLPRTREFGMTYGLGPAGYDVRCEFDEDGSRLVQYLPPGRFILASTIEMFRMPPNVMGIVHDKSTLARMGVAVQNTVIEPGWRGYLTLEITNHGSRHLEIKRGQPVAQVVFHFVDRTTTGYEGKYQDQRRGPVEPIREK